MISIFLLPVISPVAQGRVSVICFFFQRREDKDSGLINFDLRSPKSVQAQANATCNGECLVLLFMPRNVTLAECSRGRETAYNLSALVIAKFRKVNPRSICGRDLLAW